MPVPALRPDAAGALDDVGELVLDHQVTGGVLRYLQRGLQFGDALGIAAAELLPLGGERGVGGIDRLQRYHFGLVVGGADLGRALERHVLEHMRQAGDARDFLGRADVDEVEEGNHGRNGALVDHQRQSVVQLANGQVLLELLDVHGGGGISQRQAYQETEKGVTAFSSHLRPFLRQGRLVATENRCTGIPHIDRDAPLLQGGSRQSRPLGGAYANRRPGLPRRWQEFAKTVKRIGGQSARL